METHEKAEKSIDERVHQQLVYKDNRIIDLNNVILDKERQILDLQERVREHNEVATVKNQAMRIVQQKFEEMNRDKKDMSTETEPNLFNSTSSATSSKNSERRARSSSPGHVIAARKSAPTMVTSSSGTFSPPPIDPPFDSPSNRLSTLPDIDGILRKHHSRKRVTFDLNPNSILTTSGANPRLLHSMMTSSTSSSTQNDILEHALTEASSENALLRQQVVDLNSAVESMKSEYESEILKYTKEAKTAGLKAKVAATARIKELETTLEHINGKNQEETERLQEEVDTLRSSRNWEIEQNGHLRDQVAHLKEKTFKLTEELDESEKTRRHLDSEVEESKKLMELMVEDLGQAEHLINYHIHQKEAIFEDIDRLKDAISAQDRFIEVLEQDIVIYEQHIGLLRENLGASQIDHRALIKSKAFETKLLALEREKEKSDKKSNEDRLKTKALDAKCRVLVEQNEELMARLCELEMSHGGAADESKSNRRLAEQDERIRQISSALESERDVSQRLREAKESLEKELTVKRKQDDAMSSRILMDAEMTKMEAQNKVDEMSVEVEAARKKVTEVMAEVEQLRAANFELQMHIETAKRTMEELADCNEDLEKQIEQIQEDCEEKEEDYKQSTWDVENLTRQNEALRVELDGVRQGFHETRELAEEVKMLKTELHRQQELHRAQFEAACEKLDSDDDVIERKTSLEIQQEQYILAYEQQIETLKKELELKNGPVQRKTTAVLEAPRFEQIQMTSTDSEALRAEIAELRLKNSNFTEKIERLEMETKLSGELNVELGRAMLELEEHNELLRREQEAEKADEQGITRELQLQELMMQEMTEQIAKDSEELETLRAEQARLLKNLAESEIVRKEELETKNSEIHGFLEKIEELEAKLAEKERQERQETQILTSEPSESAPESSEHQTLLHSVSHDMNKLIELKDELEIAVSALKSEIWTLNGQLKASILDREGLEDKVTLLDDLIEKEKKRAISLDAELQEQIDLTERAMRRAAEAENESNQRMAECLEKETRREEIEQAYTRLNEFYNQLQEAYNMIYAQLEVAKNSSESTTTSESQQTTSSAPDDAIIDSIMTILLISRDPSISETTQQKMQKIAEKLKQLVGEFDENQKALEEQRQITQALEQRLQTIETASGAQNATTTRQRVEELEGEIEWKEEECEALKRRIRDLEKALEAVAERTEDESEAAAVSRLSTELAILAARLTTRQADVDSLFRTNAELAHTNVRLQNECDEWEEAREKMIEEKRELEQHVKELEEQVAELMEQHEAHLQQTQLLQSTTPILSPPTPNPETAAKLEESEREVIRLVAIEKTLNSRILALEDQNLELEEKFQEMEEEMMTVKAENAEKCVPTAQKSDWDDWGEQTEQTEPNEELREAKSEVERLLEVEKALTMRIESLQIHNQQLERKMKELEGKIPSTSQPPPKQDDDWGWGDDDDTEETTIQTVQISKIGNSELEMAKADVARLIQIEKMLNERIEGLEEQNSDLEERLQAMEEDLMDVKREKTVKNETWDDWGDSEGVEDSEGVVTILKKTVEELEEKCRFQKEVILKAEAQLVETQEKYDELEETYQQSQLEKPSEELLRELQTQLELTRQEKNELVMSLEQMKIQKLDIDGRFDELRENEKKLKEEDEKELLKLRDSHQQLTARITHLESENSRIQAEMNQKIASIELEKSKVEEELNETLDELEDVKKKESESVTTSSGGWNDDGWGNDDDEETQKVLEMRVETLQDELQKFKEREAELSDESSELKSRLESAENEISNLQNEIQKTSEIQEELRRVTEQNGMLKDSEGRLMDQSDDFANRMEKYREECGRMAQKLTEMEEELRKEKMEKSEQKVMEKANEIVAVLRQQLAAANTEIHRHRHQLSAKEETIAELNRHISEHTKTIEELQGKLKTVRRAPTAPRSSVSHPSRPSSQMSSTSSRMSGATTTTSSVFVPEPIQSMGSAFDVVVPQTGEPLRRRNK